MSLGGGLKLVLIGDGESPHLLKWARALQPRVQLYAISSRGFLPELLRLLPDANRLALNTSPDHGGGNIALLKQLPKVGAWLAQTDADWLHAHYLTSHGTLAWAAKAGWRLRAQIAGSAWGSDILVTPHRGASWRWLTSKVLRSCAITTSDSAHMAERMRELGAGEVMTFPFGLEAMPRQNAKKQPWLCFANRGLETIYRPQLVIDAFARIAAAQPEARLVVANDGSLRQALQADVAARGLADRVSFVGRLDASAQAAHYARSTWFLSLPQSDSVSVSVLEAMAHGCVPLLSELPANRELIGDSARGLIVGSLDDLPARMALLDTAALARTNRDWVAVNGLFEPHVQRFLTRLRELSPA
ncbi:glycosyltransferase [Roseateles saccharophilus]|uniref:Glycosyltransferase involved in cell wall biosynthesis n=1 Tax=Roseateles saccharophilus TaxID=304 RepID=A0A4V2VNG6_ROSSA|nr:glycosyltransferase [Roseateles saccharophilus]MDG0835817.1 glycosyltransferase [Roseateles saccharophilus]TCU83635.1 glycosyltransferase involved in cell wall biosynthesis [Roseateles saccharophilus]